MFEPSLFSWKREKIKENYLYMPTISLKLENCRVSSMMVDFLISICITTKVAQMFHDLEHSGNNEQIDAQRAWKVIFWQTLRVGDGK